MDDLGVAPWLRKPPYLTIDFHSDAGRSPEMCRASVQVRPGRKASCMVLAMCSTMQKWQTVRRKWKSWCDAATSRWDLENASLKMMGMKWCPKCHAYDKSVISTPVISLRGCDLHILTLKKDEFNLLNIISSSKNGKITDTKMLIWLKELRSTEKSPQRLYPDSRCCLVSSLYSGLIPNNGIFVNWNHHPFEVDLL